MHKIPTKDDETMASLTFSHNSVTLEIYLLVEIYKTKFRQHCQNPKILLIVE